MKSHILAAHGGIKFCCNDCSDTFTQQRYLLRHITLRHKANPFRYACCGHTYNLFQDFQEHKKKVHGCSKSRCHECQTIKKSRDELRFHYQSKHYKERKSGWSNENSSASEYDVTNNKKEETSNEQIDEDKNVIYESKEDVSQVVKSEYGKTYSCDAPKYMCPLQNCLYFCSSNTEVVRMLHLQSEHGINNYQQYSFIRL